ncbi:hypothetical protein [Sinomicrobium pectinilyticum]|uniref:hypothetical protein n=1 Tax=Sinomicrobium pectinilyticum TaxID=1084421 RepID=UPI0011CD9874|nr:hypothetical protein [Sinomicrobium pectinilyticum]
MKKKKLTGKLILKKEKISNLDGIKGGWETAIGCNTDEYDTCATNDCGTGGCGTGNCGTGGCVTEYNCTTDVHPVTDPIHCRTCGPCM